MATAAPGAGAPARRQFRMPFRRTDAEARGEAVEELRGERDLRHQDQALPAGADRVRHRLEIDLGLARAGDAVEERHRVAALGDRRFQLRGGGALVGGEFGWREIGIGLFATGSGGSTTVSSVPSSIRPSITPALTPASRAASLLPRTIPSARSASTRCARRGHALRSRAGQPHANALALGSKVLPHTQAHAQHHAARSIV